jgi:hypothetical protein
MWVWPGVELVLGIDGRSCSACSRDPYPKCRIGFGCDSTRPRYGRLAAPVIKKGASIFNPVGHLAPLLGKLEPRLGLKRGGCRPFRFLFALNCLLATQFRSCHLKYDNRQRRPRRGVAGTDTAPHHTFLLEARNSCDNWLSSKSSFSFAIMEKLFRSAI